MRDVSQRGESRKLPRVLSVFEAEVRRIVRETLAEYQGESDPWQPHTSWPLGSRRRCAEIARSGAIAGARRVGKVWLAKASAVAAYAETHGVLAEPKAEADEIDQILARVRGGR